MYTSMTLVCGSKIDKGFANDLLHTVRGQGRDTPKQMSAFTMRAAFDRTWQ